MKAIGWGPWLGGVTGCPPSALSVSRENELVISGPEQRHQEEPNPPQHLSQPQLLTWTPTAL